MVIDIDNSLLTTYNLVHEYPLLTVDNHNPFQFINH